MGVGTGLSLPAYRRNLEIVGIDLSPEMLEKARERVAVDRLTNVTGLHEMDAERLAIPRRLFRHRRRHVRDDSRAGPREGHARTLARLPPGRRGSIVNHFSSDDGMRGWVERRMAPFADKLGWRPVFDVERVLVCEDLQLMEKRGLRPLGLFTMMRFKKASEARVAA